MVIGILYAALAGCIWGFIFIGPALIPEYPAELLSVGRYLAFGLITLPLAWRSRARLRSLQRADWIKATQLVLVGNFLYYFFLSSSVQRIGAPIATMINGTLPVMITVWSNIRYRQQDGIWSWKALLPAFLLIFAGLGCVNFAELQHGHIPGAPMDYLSGLLYAVLSVFCWTWYPIQNADWLRHHPEKRATTWATAQGLVTLPVAVVGFVFVWWQMSVTSPDFAMPLGPRPWSFAGMMLGMGIFCSWLGTVCWNKASQRLPTALMGPLVMGETLAGLAYSFLWRQTWPSSLVFLGVVALIAGVLSVVIAKPRKTANC